MASYHMRTDMRTGEMVFIGKSGREVSGRDLAVIEARAKAGDVDARAVTRDLDFGIDEHGRPLDRAAAQALVAQQIHDCPECQAARARGEVGVSLDADALSALARAARRGDYPSRETRRRKILKVDRRRKIARAARAANR
jgi:hypothetical protein